MREASMLSMDPWQASETPDKSVLARAEVHSGVDPFECVFVCVCVCCLPARPAEAVFMDYDLCVRRLRPCWLLVVPSSNPMIRQSNHIVLN